MSATNVQSQPASPANDNPAVSDASITLTDLAKALGLDEDSLIERIGAAFLRREENSGE